MMAEIDVAINSICLRCGKVEKYRSIMANSCREKMLFSLCDPCKISANGIIIPIEELQSVPRKRRGQFIDGEF